jgi:hypothetical protein
MKDVISRIIRCNSKQFKIDVSFVAVTALSAQIMVFWFMMTPGSALNVEAASSSEILVSTSKLHRVITQSTTI